MASSSQSGSTAVKLISGSIFALSAATFSSLSTNPAHADVLQLKDLEEGSVVLEDTLNKGKSRVTEDLPGGPGSLATYGWGSAFTSTSNPVRYPTLVSHLSGPGLAFRDVKMEQDYGAVVDARGDVYLWGRGITDGDSSKGGLKPCLRNMKITALAPTPRKLYALSSDGTIYSLPTTSELLNQPAPSSTLVSILDPFHLFHRPSQSVDYSPLTPSPSKKRVKFKSFSAGQHHLLALSNTGSVWGHAVSERANWNGQMADLGEVGSAALESQESIDWGARHREAGLQIKSTVDPFLRSLLPPPGKTVDASHGLNPSSVKTSRGLTPAEDIHWSTTIHPIPVLESLPVPVSQIATSNNASYLLLSNSRVLAFGANSFGQLGLGALKTSANVRLPTEVILPSAKTCSKISAGGDMLYLEMESEAGKELFAGGMGQWGSLGNGSWSQAQGTLVRVKNISGLSEFSEKLGRQAPVGVHSLFASPTNFTLASLASSGGRNVFIWGSNSLAQLANGKKSNVALPAQMDSLPGADPAVGARMILSEGKKEVVRDLEGRKVGKKTVEQVAEAGWGGAAVYWKVI